LKLDPFRAADPLSLAMCCGNSECTCPMNDTYPCGGKPGQANSCPHHGRPCSGCKDCRVSPNDSAKATRAIQATRATRATRATGAIRATRVVPVVIEVPQREHLVLPLRCGDEVTLVASTLGDSFDLVIHAGATVKDVVATIRQDRGGFGPDVDLQVFGSDTSCLPLDDAVLKVLLGADAVEGLGAGLTAGFAGLHQEPRT